MNREAVTNFRIRFNNLAARFYEANKRGGINLFESRALLYISRNYGVNLCVVFFSIHGVINLFAGIVVN